MQWITARKIESFDVLHVGVDGGREVARQRPRGGRPDQGEGAGRRTVGEPEPDRDGRLVCAVRADLCIGCGLCVTLGNPTAPQQREFGCPADYDAINMMPWEEVLKTLTSEKVEVGS